MNDPVRSEQRRIRHANETIARLDDLRAGQIRQRDAAQERLDVARAKAAQADLRKRIERAEKILDPQNDA